ncbi:hypothetical protein NA57DRAFT_39112 [Rhizodiscina lignyota]|uniref:Regulatory protein alcR n=1 Tax=Rhizodiscina lignyota TaxID=1504668 RepID=A0A9P4IFR6_9PEZI|nr:hypothetical protein NA57DRAFT_39112 [Rhizodiscina lignyota]
MYPETIEDASDIVDPENPDDDISTNVNALWRSSSRDSSYYEPDTRPNRKRKRRMPSQKSPFVIDTLPGLMSRGLVAATNGNLVTVNLMKIYHDSMENALSCWLTERTCPYSLTVRATSDRSPASMLEEWGPDWSNRIYKRVFKLDKLVATVRGSELTREEDKAATKALHLAILSFGSQWAQASQRSRATFPYSQNDMNGRRQSPLSGSLSNTSQYGRESVEENFASTMEQEFDRTIQESTWQQARRALQDTADIESFRVVFAHIIFGLTQKPLLSDTLRRHSSQRPRQPEELNDLHSARFDARTANRAANLGSAEHHRPFQPSRTGAPTPPLSLAELEDLADKDGPPIYLEQGLRHIHTMRSKLERLEREDASSPSGITWPSSRIPPMKVSRLSAEDSKTIDLLYWLAIMFDTLSAAMHKRPLVVSDEDSEITPAAESTSADINRSAARNNLWGDHFFRQQAGVSSRTQPQRWPCSYEAAARTLNDAAPIKVLLFRKVTRLQSLLARRTRPQEEFEEAISDALSVYDYWNRTFNPFFHDCVHNHEELPHRIQSWYFCLAGHWYLATLILADVIENIDSGCWGRESHRLVRNASGFVDALRSRNSAAVAALAKAACPDDDNAPSSFSVGGEWHDALSQRALLTEPWTACLIRVFTKAGSLLIKRATASQSKAGEDATEDAAKALQRCRSCVKALWYLGRKSDMALMASELLIQAIEETQRRSQNLTGSLDFFNFQ